MRRKGSLVGSGVCRPESIPTVEGPVIIRREKAGWDTECFGREPGVMSLFIRNQTVVDDGLGAQLGTTATFRHQLTRGRRDRGRVESSAHADAHARRAKSIAHRDAEQLLEVIDVLVSVAIPYPPVGMGPSSSGERDSCPARTSEYVPPPDGGCRQKSSSTDPGSNQTAENHRWRLRSIRR